MPDEHFCLVDERNSWRDKMSKGIMPEQLQTLLDTYEENRESEAWRTSRVFEQACECILYLIDCVEKRDAKINWMEETINLLNERFK